MRRPGKRGVRDRGDADGFRAIHAPHGRGTGVEDAADVLAASAPADAVADAWQKRGVHGREAGTYAVGGRTLYNT